MSPRSGDRGAARWARRRGVLDPRRSISPGRVVSGWVVLGLVSGWLLVEDSSTPTWYLIIVLTAVAIAVVYTGIRSYGFARIIDDRLRVATTMGTIWVDPAEVVSRADAHQSENPAWVTLHLDSGRMVNVQLRSAVAAAGGAAEFMEWLDRHGIEGSPHPSPMAPSETEAVTMFLIGWLVVMVAAATLYIHMLGLSLNRSS